MTDAVAIGFEDPDLARKADRMDQPGLDALPFGVLRIDGDGRILGWNSTEAEIAGIDIEGYLGRSLFTDLAPCMDVPAFRGRFEQVRADGTRMALAFDFETTADPRARHLRVRMMAAGDAGTYWVFVKRL